jgi:hypothetical protein
MSEGCVFRDQSWMRAGGDADERCRGQGRGPSELLDLSPGVVKVQSMRALARLRTLLGEDEAPPPLPPEPGARDAVPRPPVARSRP